MLIGIYYLVMIYKYKLYRQTNYDRSDLLVLIIPTSLNDNRQSKYFNLNTYDEKIKIRHVSL